MGKASKNKKNIGHNAAEEAHGSEEKNNLSSPEMPGMKKKKSAQKANPHGNLSPDPCLSPEHTIGEQMLSGDLNEASRAQNNADMLSHEQRDKHAEQVEKIARSLFAALETLHQLDKKWERRLGLAARFHDLGWRKGGKGHHKASMKIIEQEDFGILPEDRPLVALLARYHRKAWPSGKHRRFAALEDGDQMAVRKLAAILRIADGLDYTHTSAVKDVSAKTETRKHEIERVAIVVEADGDIEQEIARGLKKGDLFEDIFSVHLRIVPAKQQ